MSNHFNYLLHEAKTTPSVGADRLLLMAKTAARRYLEEGTPLNDTITKIASDSDLNQQQVSRVCEMANISTHQSLWPSAGEKEKIAFPLASPKAVIIRLGGSGDMGSGPEGHTGCTPPTSIASDYMSPPSLPSPGPSMSDLFGVDPDASHEGLHEVGPQRKIIVILQKKAAEKQAIEDELIVRTMQYESEKKAAYKAVKQEVLVGASLSDIQHAAYAAGFGKIASEILSEFKDRLISETHGRIRANLEKVAIAPAPDDYISNHLGNISVVNGAHPILISLDTLHRQDDTLKQLFTGLTRVNDEVKFYNQKIREMQ